MKTLKKIDKAGVMFREVECDDRLKKVMGQRINPNVEKIMLLENTCIFMMISRKSGSMGLHL